MNFFVNAAKSIAENFTADETDPISTMTYIPNSNFQLDPTAVAEIKCIILGLKPSAPGLGKVTSDVLKCDVEYTVMPLSLRINVYILLIIIVNNYRLF